MLLQKLEESIVHSLHLVIKDNKMQGQQHPNPQVQSYSSPGPSGYSPPSFQPRPTPQVQALRRTACSPACFASACSHKRPLWHMSMAWWLAATVCYAAITLTYRCLSAFSQARQGTPAHTAQAQNAQPQNAAMLAAYQAALNSFVNNRQPQQAGPQGQQPPPNAAQGGPQPGGPQQPQPAQGQQPNQSTAPAQSQAPMYAMQAPPMLAYIPVLVSYQCIDLGHAAHKLLCISMQS